MITKDPRDSKEIIGEIQGLGTSLSDHTVCQFESKWTYWKTTKEDQGTKEARLKYAKMHIDKIKKLLEECSLDR